LEGEERWEGFLALFAERTPLAGRLETVFTGTVVEALFRGGLEGLFTRGLEGLFRGRLEGLLGERLEGLLAEGLADLERSTPLIGLLLTL
jgi:hypothetical protein